MEPNFSLVNFSELEVKFKESQNSDPRTEKNSVDLQQILHALKIFFRITEYLVPKTDVQFCQLKWSVCSTEGSVL